MFFSVEVNDVLETVNELVECALVLQNEHITKIGNISLFIWQISHPLIDFQEALLYACHVFTEVSPVLLPFKYPVYYSLTSCSTLLLLLPQLILSVSRLNLLCLYTSFFLIDLVPELSPRLNCSFHLHNLYAWSRVSSHQVFKIENPQN